LAGRVKLLWSRRAQAKLREIRNLIHADDPLAARKWVAGIRKMVRTLQDHPELGRIVPEYERPDLQERIYPKNYRIVYQIEADQIIIVTIAHAAQQLPDDL
jgi:addiction module RelE/StbE family toxin